MNVLLQRAIDDYLEGRRASIEPISLESERHVLNQWAEHMGGLQPRQIGRTAIQRWLVEIEGRADTTKRNRYTIVRMFFDDMVRDPSNPIKANPLRQVPVPKVARGRHRSLNWEQSRNLVRACTDSRERCIVVLGLQLGLRRAELAGIRLEDIDWAEERLYVVGKGGHSRNLPIPSEALRAITDYLDDSPAAHGPLLRNDRFPERGVNPVWVGRKVSAIAKRAGVKRFPWDGVSTHALRHTAATHVARNTGGNVVQVRDFLGHANIATSQVYIDEDAERLRDAISGRTYMDDTEEAA
jgi:integrase